MILSSRQKLKILIKVYEWFIKWNEQITDDYHHHRLGYAKENLKMMICPNRQNEFFDEYETDEICYIIGDWYLEWKGKFIDKSNKTHSLNKAVNDLLVRFDIRQNA